MTVFVRFVVDDSITFSVVSIPLHGSGHLGQVFQHKFVSKLADKCLAFFKILRKNKAFEWTNESEMAFQQLKEYMGSPPLLTIPNMGEELSCTYPCCRPGERGAH